MSAGRSWEELGGGNERGDGSWGDKESELVERTLSSSRGERKGSGNELQ